MFIGNVCLDITYFFAGQRGGGHGPSGPVVNTILVLKATVRKRWHLARMKDQDPAVNYRCEIDTAVLAEKHESADVNTAGVKSPGKVKSSGKSVYSCCRTAYNTWTQNQNETGGEERNKLKSTFRRRLQIRNH